MELLKPEISNLGTNIPNSLLEYWYDLIRPLWRVLKPLEQCEKQKA